MRLARKVIAITGGGSGIGRALALRFSEEHPRALFVIDIDEAKAQETVSEIAIRLGERQPKPICESVQADVTNSEAIQSFVDDCERQNLGIDLFCSNAGIAVGGGLDISDRDWELSWQVNTMAHLYAARAVVPKMIERGEGYLLQTVSAAGLLTNLGAAPYTVTKHAAQALAEWLYITYADKGIKVSTLCPQGVNTPLISAATYAGKEGTSLATEAIFASGALMEPEEVAESALRGIEAEDFLILPHPQVANYLQRKGADTQRWLQAMRKFQADLEKKALQKHEE